MPWSHNDLRRSHYNHNSYDFDQQEISVATAAGQDSSDSALLFIQPLKLVVADRAADMSITKTDITSEP